jgi:hypothetical protein
MPPAPYAILRDVSKPRSRHSTTVESDDLPGNRKPGASSSEPSSERPGNVVDIATVRRRPPSIVEGRRALVLTLVEQLSALLRGTTTATQAAAVRRAASRALDLLDRVDEGEADLSEADQALREVEAMLVHRRH